MIIVYTFIRSYGIHVAISINSLMFCYNLQRKVYVVLMVPNVQVVLILVTKLQLLNFVSQDLLYEHKDRSLQYLVQVGLQGSRPR